MNDQPTNADVIGALDRLNAAIDRMAPAPVSHVDDHPRGGFTSRAGATAAEIDSALRREGARLRAGEHVDHIPMPDPGPRLEDVVTPHRTIDDLIRTEAHRQRDHGQQAGTAPATASSTRPVESLMPGGNPSGRDYSVSVDDLLRRSFGRAV